MIADQPHSATKKLSIIVPCYKVELYLDRCIASLISQTLKDIEIICINDGSPDECLNIMRSWEHSYPDRVVVIDKPNEGVWRGRWDGIRIARGEYIGFLDSDDYAEPDFAQALYTAAKSADADLAVCGFSRIEQESGKVLSRELCTPRKPFSFADDPGRMVELNGAPWNKIFRASILKQMRDLPAPPPVLDDIAFHLLAYLDMKGETVFVPRSLVNYMVRSGSIINTMSAQQIPHIYGAFSQVKTYYNDAGASPALQEALDACAFLHLGISVNYRLAADPDNDLKTLIPQCTRFLDEHFPTWRHSPYFTGRYARINGQSFKRLRTVWHLYRLDMLPTFLRLYSFIITHCKVDFKW